MAASFISNDLQVNFDSVLGFSENEGMVNVFKSLESTGLHGLLGYPFVLYEDDLVSFFANSVVKDDESTGLHGLLGYPFVLYEDDLVSFFANSVVKDDEDLIYDARSIFSMSGEPVKTSCKKREMKYEFRLLNDILAKSVTVKARSFDDVTHERFLLMTAINFGVKVNWSKLLFDILKEMADQSSNRAKDLPTTQDSNIKDSWHVCFQELNIADDETEDPVVAKAAVVKKKAMSKRRQAPTADEPVAKKKRTTVGRPAPAEKEFVMVPVVQNPKPISVVPAATPRAQRRRASKRKLMLKERSDDEIVDSIIHQVIAETADIETGEPDLEEPVVKETTEPTVVETESRIDVSATINDDEEEPLVETEKEAEKDKEIEPVATEGMSLEKITAFEDTEPLSKVLAHTEKSTSDEESMSIDDLLVQIPENMMLPSVTVAEPTRIKFGLGIEIPGVNDGDWYKASLPQIAIADKGKVPLVKKDEIKGHQAREMFSLICADIEFLVQLREKVIDEISSFFSSFNLRRLVVLGSVSDIFAKEEQILVWAETDSLQTAVSRRLYIIAKYREMLLRNFLEARNKNFDSGTPTTVIDLQVLDMLIDAHRVALEKLLENMREHKLEWTRTINSRLFEEAHIDHGKTIHTDEDGVLCLRGASLLSVQKKDLKVECRLLKDIVAKAFNAKVGCFDNVTHGRFDLMVAIMGATKNSAATQASSSPRKKISISRRKARLLYRKLHRGKSRRFLTRTRQTSRCNGRLMVELLTQINTYVDDFVTVDVKRNYSPLMADARLPLLATYKYPIEIARIPHRFEILSKINNKLSREISSGSSVQATNPACARLRMILFNRPSAKTSCEDSRVRATRFSPEDFERRGDKLKDDLSSEITTKRLMLKQSAEINANLASLRSQLAEVVAHIKRPGDVKKGEGGSSSSRKGEISSGGKRRWF
ncbi:zinc finger protein CONSTANS-LIKE 5-like [Dorcoceras hygrometricum]|uniref:Zinc finger protein CONSTANS-LIKE 5-like n=1 Tax=Dorcoceras hygrometricum TaxID=472368 RepID=A0A2Z7BUZ0_9LAMI|nr:zinc finger protein CONSTANS-LIKE 5-like [Dorcoceras hygrometricum]